MSDTDRRDTVDADPGGDLHEMLKRRERNLRLSLRTGSPATVVAYDPATQTATLTVDTLAVESTILPVAVPDPPQQLLRVPVVFPRAMGGAAYDTMPVLPGDTGSIRVLDRATDEWRRLGIPSDPVDGRTHSQADAVFDLGLHPDTDPIIPPTSLTARVIEAPLINLGAGAVLGVVHDNGGLAAQIAAQILVLQAVTGVGPDGPNVEAIAASLTLILQALAVSVRVTTV